MDILHLTLKKKWFDMILSGEKKEEYREIKPYWETRLSNFDGEQFLHHKNYDVVIFKNGYQKDAPTMEVECSRIYCGYGRDEWGGIGQEKYYIIELGNVLSTQNCSVESE